MVWLKRIFLFALVNILVMITLSTVLNLLGVRPYLNAYGLNYEHLAIFALVWGMGGSLISLAISKPMVKWSMGVKVVDPATTDAELGWLVRTVHRHAQTAGLTSMPEVGIYDSPDLNAFATGATKNSSIVAVSSGLLSRMRREEVDGVIGHEVAHIANGDMVTLTLIQGIVNAFVIFLSRIAGFVLAQALSGRRDDDGERSGGGGTNYFLMHALTWVFEIAFTILGTMVVAWFSRWREFRADAGGAQYAGRSHMIAALKRLKSEFEGPALQMAGQSQPATVQALKISGKPSGFLRLFSTHPPLEDRIARLEEAQMRGSY